MACTHFHPMNGYIAIAITRALLVTQRLFVLFSAIDVEGWVAQCSGILVGALTSVIVGQNARRLEALLGSDGRLFVFSALCAFVGQCILFFTGMSATGWIVSCFFVGLCRPDNRLYLHAVVELDASGIAHATKTMLFADWFGTFLAAVAFANALNAAQSGIASLIVGVGSLSASALLASSDILPIAFKDYIHNAAFRADCARYTITSDSDDDENGAAVHQHDRPPVVDVPGGLEATNFIRRAFVTIVDGHLPGRARAWMLTEAMHKAATIFLIAFLTRTERTRLSATSPTVTTVMLFACLFSTMIAMRLFTIRAYLHVWLFTAIASVFASAVLLSVDIAAPGNWAVHVSVWGILLIFGAALAMLPLSSLGAWVVASPERRALPDFVDRFFYYGQMGSYLAILLWILRMTPLIVYGSLVWLAYHTYDSHIDEKLTEYTPFWCGRKQVVHSFEFEPDLSEEEERQHAATEMVVVDHEKKEEEEEEEDVVVHESNPQSQNEIAV